MKKIINILIAFYILSATITNVSGQSWNLAGNSGTNPSTQFIGTSDNKSLRFRTNNFVRLQITNSGKLGFGTGTSTPAGWFHIKGKNNESQLIVDAAVSQNNSFPLIRLRSSSGVDLLWLNSDHPTNCFLGQGAGSANNASSATSEGKFNTFIGRGSGSTNNFGAYNTALGNQSLLNNQNGGENTAIGSAALLNNTTGSANTAVGSLALESNNGINNTAVGSAALDLNTSGSNNVAVGYNSLSKNTDRNNLVAIGANALYNNGTGASAFYHSTNNTAVGNNALYTNTIGDGNTATGYLGLFSNTEGFFNTSSGINALYYNSTGSDNSGFGTNSLYNNQTGSSNVAIGTFSGVGGTGTNYNQCTFVGADSYTNVSRDNITMLGWGITNGQCTGNNQVLLGNTAVSQLRAPVTGITAYSDGRYKTNVKDDIRGLDFITKLNPVSYNVRPSELHKIWGTPDSISEKINHSQVETIRYTGFIAQEVEKAARESGYDFTGIDIPHNDHEAYALRYTEFIMPIVKAIKEQQSIIEKQNERIVTLEQQLSSLLSDGLKQPGSKHSGDESQLLLSQNSPNPFKEKTVIKFYISENAGSGLIKIYAPGGSEIKSIPVSAKGFGETEISADALSAGTYNYMLFVDRKVMDTKQMVVTK
ncbi:MAG: tail fiber domain-containing protein [Bacteroidota bacterium]